MAAVASCGGSETPAQQKTDRVNSTPPTRVLIVVNNLESYFEDCGCSGANQGGISRIVSAAEGEKQTILFVGRTLFPTSLYAKWKESSPNVMAQFAYHAQVASIVLSKISDAVVLLDNTDSEILSRLKAEGADLTALLPHVRRDATIAWGSLSVQMKDDHTLSIGGNGMSIPLPEGSARGRIVQCVAIWEFGDAGKPIVDHVLSSALQTGTDRGTIVERLAEHRSQGACVLAHWQRDVTRDLTEFEALAEMLKEQRTGRTHMLSAFSQEAILPLKHDSKVLHQHWLPCASCHAEAFAAWTKSAHYTALHTLEIRWQANDLRCLACHSSFGEGVSKGPAHLAAVTCDSCHKPGSTKVELSICEGCHTRLTDPLSHYKAGFHKVCESAVGPTPAGKCSR